MKKIILFTLLMTYSIMASEKLEVLSAASIGSAGRNLASQSGNTYVPDNMIDNNLNTTWALPYKSGEVMLQFYLRKTAEVLNRITIHNGYTKSEQRFQDNSRAKKIAIYINGITKDYLFGTVTLDDSMQPQEIDLGNVKDVRVVYIRVLSIYPGEKWSDLCISEVSFDGVPKKENTEQYSDLDEIYAKEAGYTVGVSERKLALNNKQIETLSHSRYIVLTTEQKQSLSPVWDVDTLSLLPTNWYDCSCGMYNIQWTDLDSVYLPGTSMPSQAFTDAMDIIYGPHDKTYGYDPSADSKDNDWKEIPRTFLGLDGQLYQSGKPVPVEDLIKQQRKNYKIIKYEPGPNCSQIALSIDFPPATVMDERIAAAHKDNLIRRGLKFCEMNSTLTEIRGFADGH